MKNVMYKAIALALCTSMVFSVNVFASGTVAQSGPGENLQAEESKVSVVRLGGDTRYNTASAIAKEAFPDGTKSIVLVSGENFPDALSANALAGANRGAMLLTAKDKIPDATAALLTSWKPDTVTIVGGESSVSAAVETSLKTDYGVTTVSRIFGKSRYETAENVYYEGKKAGAQWGDTVIIATGSTPADAISCSSLSYARIDPMLFASGGSLDEEAYTIAKNFTSVLILGGVDSVSKATEQKLTDMKLNVKRLAGGNRYETSVAIANETADYQGGTYNRTAFASGLDSHFSDALVTGMLQGSYQAAIVLVDGTEGAGFDLVHSTYVDNTDINTLYFLGGSDSMPDKTVNKIMSYINQSAEMKEAIKAAEAAGYTSLEGKTYTADLKKDENGYICAKKTKFDKGYLNCVLHDFDQDGKDEMLLLTVEDTYKDAVYPSGTYQAYDFRLHMFEADDKGTFTESSEIDIPLNNLQIETHCDLFYKDYTDMTGIYYNLDSEDWADDSCAGSLIQYFYKNGEFEVRNFELARFPESSGFFMDEASLRQEFGEQGVEAFDSFKFNLPDRSGKSGMILEQDSTCSCIACIRSATKVTETEARERTDLTGLLTFTFSSSI